MPLEAKGRKARRKFKILPRKKVLKMLAVMEAQHSATEPGNKTPSAVPSSSADRAAHTQEFLASGRTGRRNALPDILGEHALVTSSDLPDRLQSLTTSEQQQGNPSGSNQNTS